MKINGSDVRAGMVVEYQDKLWLVVKHEIRTPGNLRSFNQVELKDVQAGTKNNIRLAADEKMERVTLDSRTCNFLYAEDDLLNFMDNENYEQFVMDKEMIGDALPFLQDGMTVDVEMYEGKAITAKLPQRVTVTIAEADPVVKGQTASSSYKPAILENGVRVMVPPFIPSGETIVVDTTTLEYVERAKAS
ncbi:MAG: elongation factor P [Rickettsiales bacterium]